MKSIKRMKWKTLTLNLRNQKAFYSNRTTIFRGLSDPKKSTVLCKCRAASLSFRRKALS